MREVGSRTPQQTPNFVNAQIYKMMQNSQLPVSLDAEPQMLNAGIQTNDTEGLWVVRKFPYAFCPGSPLVNI